jgi:hypothetical protein
MNRILQLKVVCPKHMIRFPLSHCKECINHVKVSHSGDVHCNFNTKKR